MPIDEKSARSPSRLVVPSVFSEAPTVTQFLHVAGEPIEPSPSPPELPAAKRMTRSSDWYMAASVCAAKREGRER